MTVEREENGFILLEILVAVAILGLALSNAMPTLSGAMDWLRQGGQAGLATMQAHSLLERIGHDIPSMQGQWDGTSADGYRWKLDISLYETIPSPQGSPLVINLARATVQPGPSSGSSRAVELSTLISPRPTVGP